MPRRRRKSAVKEERTGRSGLPSPEPSSQPPYRWRLSLCLALTVFAAVVMLYSPSLRYPFVFDDIHNIAENPSIKIEGISLPEILEATGDSYSVESTRPVAFYTFALNYYFGGLDPIGYRLINIIIHGINSLLVAALAFTLTAEARGEPPSPLIPFGAALLWAVHPVQSSAVVYVVQRMTSLATLFYLAAFLSYIRGRKGSGRVYYVLVVVFYLMASLSKEIAYILPLLILLYEVCFNEGFRQWIRAKRYLMAALPLLGLLAFAAAIYSFQDTYALRPFTWQQRLLTEARVVARYLSLLAFPHPSRLLADYSAYPLSHGLLLPPVTLGAVLLHLAAVTLGVLSLVSRPLLGFTILGFYGHLVMESTVVPLRIAYEHRLYLPSVFLAVGLAFAWSRLTERGGGVRTMRIFGAAVVAAAFVWGMWTHERTATWSDPVTFWSDVARKTPANAKAHAGLGAEYWKRGEYRAARTHLMKAIELNSRDLKSLLNLGLVEAETGNNRRSLSLLRSVLEGGYRQPQVFYNIGIVSWRAGDRAAAVENLKAALQYDRRLPDVNYYIASIYHEMGELALAREYAGRELLLNPAHAGARELRALLDGRKRAP